MPIDLHGFCCAGSDDGRVYIWDAKSGDVICALEADEDIVNSVAAHPSLPYLATSGIEDKVRIWGPHSSPVYQDLSEQIQRNQVGLLVYLAPYQRLLCPYSPSTYCCALATALFTYCSAMIDNVIVYRPDTLAVTPFLLMQRSTAVQFHSAIEHLQRLGGQLAYSVTIP